MITCSEIKVNAESNLCYNSYNKVQENLYVTKGGFYSTDINEIQKDLVLQKLFGDLKYNPITNDHPPHLR